MTSIDSALAALKAGDFQARWEMVKDCAALGEAIVPSLVALLKEADTDEELAWFIVKILGTFREPEAVIALLDLLDPDQPEDLSAIASEVLASMGAEVLEPLAPLLEDPSRQRLGVRAIAQINHPEAVPRLLKVWAAQPAPEVRQLIVEALHPFPALNTIPVFLQALTDESAKVRQGAIAGLVACKSLAGDDAAHNVWVEAMLPSLGDPVPAVAEQAARALGRFATATAVAALIQKGKNITTTSALRYSIIQALGWVGTPEAIEGLIQIWEGLSQHPAPPEPLLKEILVSLSRTTIAQTEAAQATVALLRSPSLNVSISLQSTAAFCLGRLGIKATLPHLIALLAEPDYGLRLQVIAALKQIAPDSAHAELLHCAADPDMPPSLADGLAIALQEW